MVAPSSGQTSSFLSNSDSSHSALSMSIEDSQDSLEEPFNALFCRALYDYEAQDPSALSFRKDDIIEVLSQEPSGWWDGLVGEDRGWFPSNYVAVISEEEAEAVFSSAEAFNMEPHPVQHIPNGTSTSTAPAHQPQDSVIDMSHAMMRGTQQENEDWLGQELSNSNAQGFDDLVQSSWDSGQSSSDFWMPQVAPNGQVCSITGSFYFVAPCVFTRRTDILCEHEDRTTEPGFTARV